jgi:hypothetical protein
LYGAVRQPVLARQLPQIVSKSGRNQQDAHKSCICFS